MSMTIHVDIVSAEGSIHTGVAEMVFAPAEMGEVGIAARHAPMICRLEPGEVRVQNGAEEAHIYVSGGMLEVQPHMVTILADTAVRARDIDEAAALDAKRKAEEALSNRTGEFEYAKAQSELAEAVAQLRTLDKLRKRNAS